MPLRSHLAAMVPRITFIAFAVFATITAFAPTTARAQTTYQDCRVCTDIPSWSGLTGNTVCDYPANNSTGFSGCTERNTIFGIICMDGKTPCFYTCVGTNCDTGGGSYGGGGTGSGGSDCSGGGYCPVDCFSCGGMYY